MLSGALIVATGRAPPWYIAGGIPAIAGRVCLYKVDTSAKIAAIYGFEALVAIGVGLTFQNGYVLASAAVKSERASACISLINLSQIGGSTVALSIAGAIFQNRGFVMLQHALQGFGYPNSELRSLMLGAQSEILQHGTEEVKMNAITAIVEAMGMHLQSVAAA
jgi:hypothetical protein